MTGDSVREIECISMEKIIMKLEIFRSGKNIVIYIVQRISTGKNENALQTTLIDLLLMLVLHRN